MLAAVWVFKRLLSICVCGHAVSFQPQFNGQIVPGWGAVFCDARCLESPVAAAVMRFDVTAWDSVTVPRSPSHSALGALLHPLAWAPGQRSFWDTWDPSHCSALPSLSFPPLQSFKGSTITETCWSDAVFLSLCHTYFLWHYRSQRKIRLPLTSVCYLDLILKPGIGCLKFQRFYSCICYWSFPLSLFCFRHWLMV